MIRGKTSINMNSINIAMKVFISKFLETIVNSSKNITRKIFLLIVNESRSKSDFWRSLIVSPAYRLFCFLSNSTFNRLAEKKENSIVDSMQIRKRLIKPII